MAWVWKFDLVSIAFMAFVCFSVIVTVLLLDRGPAAVSTSADDLQPISSRRTRNRDHESPKEILR